jgi:hypothetical protein
MTTPDRKPLTVMQAIGEKLGFIGLQRRNWCIGHIINLVTKALLFGKNPDIFEERARGQLPLTTAEYHDGLSHPTGSYEMHHPQKT